jgi:hypothetical protein
MIDLLISMNRADSALVKPAGADPIQSQCILRLARFNSTIAS